MVDYKAPEAMVGLPLSLSVSTTTLGLRLRRCVGTAFQSQSVTLGD